MYCLQYQPLQGGISNIYPQYQTAEFCVVLWSCNIYAQCICFNESYTPSFVPLFCISVCCQDNTIHFYVFDWECPALQVTCIHYWTAPLLSKVVMLYFYGRCKVSCLFVAVNVVNGSVCTLIAVIYWWKLVFFDNPKFSLMSRSKIRIFFSRDCGEHEFISARKLNSSLVM